MSDHTPGPWTQKEFSEHDFRFTIAIRDKNERDVAEICGNYGESVLHKANANLIAAAPDLLAALKGVLPYMEEAEAEGLIGDEGCHWPVEIVRAAIAKAEGRS